MFRMIWPEERMIDDTIMLTWGSDAFDNNDIDKDPKDAAEAATLLHEAGLITLGKI